MDEMTIEMQITALPLASIAPDVDQPRKRFDEAQLAELARSLDAAGLLEPIIVRPNGSPTSYVIVAGERRYRAATRLGWPTIPAIVRRDLDAAAAFEVSMVENLARADMTPVEEARGYRRMVETGLTVDEVARRLGKTSQDVRFHLALLDLDEPIADLVDAGQINAWDGWHISRLTVESQHRVIRAMNAGELRQAGDVRRFALAVLAQESQVSAFAESEVAPAAGVVAADGALRIELEALLGRIAAVDRLVGSAEPSLEALALALAAKRGAAAMVTRIQTRAAQAQAARWAS